MSLWRSMVQGFGVKTYRFLFRQQTNHTLRKIQESGQYQRGRHSYGNPRIDFHEGTPNKDIVGNFCSIAGGVVVIPGGIHPVDWVSTYPFRIKWNLPGAYQDGSPTSKGDVIIGSDVWIGTEAMILSGVNIGHGAVIAARAVVTRDVPPYAIVAGVPARVVRLRFSEDIIAQLLDIAWWDWDDNRISEAVALLSSDSISEFIRVYGGNTGTSDLEESAT